MAYMWRQTGIFMNQTLVKIVFVFKDASQMKFNLKYVALNKLAFRALHEHIEGKVHSQV